MVRIEAATEAHAAALAPMLRAEDRREIAASGGRSTAASLRSGLHSSSEAWAAFQGECFLGMFGVTSWSEISGHGCLWLVASDASYRRPKTFFAAAKRQLEVLSTRWPVLSIAVCGSELAALRMAQRLGFKAACSFDDPITGRRFEILERRR